MRSRFVEHCLSNKPVNNFWIRSPLRLSNWLDKKSVAPTLLICLRCQELLICACMWANKIKAPFDATHLVFIWIDRSWDAEPMQNKRPALRTNTATAETGWKEFLVVVQKYFVHCTNKRLLLKNWCILYMPPVTTIRISSVTVLFCVKTSLWIPLIWMKTCKFVCVGWFSNTILKIVIVAMIIILRKEYEMFFINEHLSKNSKIEMFVFIKKSWDLLIFSCEN